MEYTKYVLTKLDAFIHFLAQHAPLIANESLTHLKTKDVCGKQVAHVNKVNMPFTACHYHCPS